MDNEEYIEVEAETEENAETSGKDEYKEGGTSRVIRPAQIYEMPEKTERPAFSIAGFVLSLIGLVLCPTVIFSVIPTLLGLIFGAVGIKRGLKGLGISAVVISIVTMLLIAVILVLYALLAASLFNAVPEILEGIGGVINAL